MEPRPEPPGGALDPAAGARSSGAGTTRGEAGDVRPWWTTPRWRLATIVAGSIVLWGGAASLSRSPWIFVDELIYSELARSIASGSEPAVRGIPSIRAYGLVYPALISPAWLASSTKTAYELTHLINAGLISLVALPAYALARRFVSERLALLVALFSVAVPSMAYAATVLTEVAFYPLFVLAVAAMARALDSGSARDQVLALGAIALVSATKVLGIALAGAWLLAVALTAVLALLYDGVPLKASLRRFRVTVGAVVGIAALLAAASVARGSSPTEWFGVYGAAVSNVPVSAVPLEFLQHLAALSLYTAVIPLAAAILVVAIGFRGGADARVRAFAVLAVSVVVATTSAVSVFAAYASNVSFDKTGVPPATPVYERNLFSVGPLLLLALAVWIGRGLPRAGFAARFAAGGSALILIVYPWRLIPRAANPQNLAPILLSVLPLANWLIAAVTIGLASLMVVVFLQASRERARVLWAVVGTWFAIVGLVAVVIFTGASRNVARSGAGDPVDWVDRTVGRDARVVILWKEPGRGAFAPPSKRQRTVWLAEVFNRSVGAVFVLGPGLPYGLAQTRVRARPGGAVIDAAGRPMAVPFVLASCRLGVRAPLVASDVKTQMGLYRVGGPVVLGGSAGRCPRPS